MGSNKKDTNDDHTCDNYGGKHIDDGNVYESLSEQDVMTAGKEIQEVIDKHVDVLSPDAVRKLSAASAIATNHTTALRTLLDLTTTLNLFAGMSRVSKLGESLSETDAQEIVSDWLDDHKEVILENASSTGHLFFDINDVMESTQKTIFEIIESDRLIRITIKQGMN